MFENRKQAILPKSHFWIRLIRNIMFGLLLILICLGIGMWGYHHFEKLSWLDSYLSAAMILSGMGPVTELKTVGGKLFAGTYALFSGIGFLIIVGIIFAPIFHRFLHQFHVDEIKSNPK